MDNVEVLEMLKESVELKGMMVFSVRVGSDSFKAYVIAGKDFYEPKSVYAFDVSREEAHLEAVGTIELLDEPQVW